jgi:hypothetical protein
MRTSAFSQSSWPGLTRPSKRLRRQTFGAYDSCPYDVDGRVKPGHDGKSAEVAA